MLFLYFLKNLLDEILQNSQRIYNVKNLLYFFTYHEDCKITTFITSCAWSLAKVILVPLLDTKKNNVDRF